MAPFDRFAVVLDACTLFPAFTRDVLLTLASYEFFNPKWSPRIRDEWMRNLSKWISDRQGLDARDHVARIAAAADVAFPDATVDVELPELEILEPVDIKDRHVVMTAVAAQADAIVTFNLTDFAVDHLREQLRLEVIHPDDFVMDLVDLNEKRAVAAFRALRARKKSPPWDRAEVVKRAREAGLVETSLWLNSRDVAALI